MLLGIQHLVRKSALFEQPGQVFGGLDRRRPDQHRLLALLTLFDILDNRVILPGLVQKHQVRLIIANHVPVSRNNDDLEPIDLLKFECLCIRGTGHTGQRFVHAEVILERDRRDGLVFLLDPDAFLRLNSLVKTVRPTPSRHGPPGKFIDDDDLTVIYDVFDVTFIKRMSSKPGRQMMHEPDVAGII